MKLLKLFTIVFAAWLSSLGAAEKASPEISVQLLPNLEQGKPPAGVTSMMVGVRNPTGNVLRNVSVVLSTPPIERLAVPKSWRFALIDGGEAGSKSLKLTAPELRPGEDREIWVYFETPEPFRSAEEWKRTYRYPGDVFTLRLTVGGLNVVKPTK